MHDNATRTSAFQRVAIDRVGDISRAAIGQAIHRTSGKMTAKWNQRRTPQERVTVRYQTVAIIGRPKEL